MFALEWPARLPPLLAAPVADSVPGDTVIMVPGISTTGSATLPAATARPAMNGRADHGRASGFTLIEMIVVLVILGLMAGLVLARGPLHSQRLDIDAAARGLAGTLRLARGQAIAQHHPVVVAVAANAYRLDRTPLHAVPTDVALSGDAAIRFAPDGSSSGGHIAVRGSTGRIDIGVDWLTGRVFLTSRQ
jgi:general secretion pathway protein H